MDIIYLVIIIILLVAIILLILNNNQDVNKYIDYTKEQFNTIPTDSKTIVSTSAPILSSSVSVLEPEKKNDKNNKMDILDTNYVSPYAIAYSSFYYDHNKDPYIGIYSNKNWLYDPWNTNLKYI